MGRKPTGPLIVKRIEEIWAGEFRKSINAPLVRKFAKLEFGDRTPGVSKVWKIIADLKKRGGLKCVPPDPPLEPWGKGWPTAPEDIAYLFQTLAVARKFYFGFSALKTKEVEWVLKLRSVFWAAAAENDKEQAAKVAAEQKEKALLNCLVWASAYAQRNRLAEVLGHPQPYTADLDAILEFRVWEGKESFERYREAVKQGEVPEMSIERQHDLAELERPGFRHGRLLWHLQTLDQLNNSAQDGTKLPADRETAASRFQDEVESFSIQLARDPKLDMQLARDPKLKAVWETLRAKEAKDQKMPTKLPT